MLPQRGKQLKGGGTEDIIQSEHLSFCPSPLCCSVNGQWDDGACGALSSEDRYALMHQQLQALLKMSAHAHAYIQSGV